jgi:hypothetical protein
MKIIACRLPGGPGARAEERAAWHEPASGLGASWVQFGDELVLIVGDDEGVQAAGRAAERGLHPTERASGVRPENLYLVAQKGRLFEQEYRRRYGEDASILVNRGRFVLVDLDPARARSLECGDAPCYAVRPLEANQVVFERRAPGVPRAPVPWVQELVDRVETASFRADLEALVGFGTRLSTRAEYLEAATFARGELAKIGYEARLEPIAVPGGSSWNVIADRPGSGGARQVVLVTAHLDSVNLPGGPAAPAPGADDDGSGSAGALQIARALQEHAGQHDLRIILFGGEEQGLHGSTQYVASLAPPERARIQAVVNMDMIGTLNVSPASVLIEGAAVSQAVIDDLAAAAATYTDLVVETSLNPFNSDHVPFIRKQIAAVLTIEGADQTNENVHSANDTLDRINTDLAVSILRMNVALVASRLGQHG